MPAYAQKNGKGAALSAFSNKSGPFVAGNVYIYALDYSGHALALPYQPQLVGNQFLRHPGQCRPVLHPDRDRARKKRRRISPVPVPGPVR